MEWAIGSRVETMCSGTRKPRWNVTKTLAREIGMWGTHGKGHGVGKCKVKTGEQPGLISRRTRDGEEVAVPQANKKNASDRRRGRFKSLLPSIGLVAEKGRRSPAPLRRKEPRVSAHSGAEKDGEINSPLQRRKSRAGGRWLEFEGF